MLGRGAVERGRVTLLRLDGRLRGRVDVLERGAVERDRLWVRDEDDLEWIESVAVQGASLRVDLGAEDTHGALRD